MNLPYQEDFQHDGQLFTVHAFGEGEKFGVFVTLGAECISPTYSVEITTHTDYFLKHKQSLIDHLIEIAKSDIKEEMYYSGSDDD